MTLRSSIDLSMDEDFVNTSKANETSRSGSKDVKTLLKSVFSTNPISTSLKKLTELGRSSSPQTKVFQSRLNRSNNSSRSKSKDIFRAQSTSMYEKEDKIEKKKKELGFVYVLDFREDVVWNYILSNGYIGTYEPNYKTLFNRHDGIYFEVDENRMLKKLKKGD